MSVRMIRAFGGSPIVIAIPDLSQTATRVSPQNPSAAFELRSDGGSQTVRNGTVFDQGAWINKTSAAGNYYVRFTQTASTGSGSITGGTTGVWQQLNVDRGITVNTTVVNTHTRTFTIEVAADSGGSNIVATRTGVVLTVIKET